MCAAARGAHAGGWRADTRRGVARSEGGLGGGGEHVPGGRIGVAQEQGEETRRRGFTLAGYSARGRDVVRGGRRVGAAYVPGHDAASGV